jgi:FG-GAP-like repeat/Secretion system C-terminal sorting domain
MKSSLPTLLLVLVIGTSAFAWSESDWPNHEMLLESNVFDMESTDLDGDGDVDIVFTQHEQPVQWFQNDGTGSFSIQILPLNYDLLGDISVGDIDNDGDPDLVLSNQHELMLFVNLGAATFTAVQISDEDMSRVWNKLYDMDGDGDLDILTDFGDEARWYENNLDYSFDMHPLPLLDGGGQTLLGDVDSDGDVDILYLYSIIGFSYVKWLENTGDMQFDVLHTIHEQYEIYCLAGFQDENEYRVFIYEEVPYTSYELIELTYVDEMWENELLTHSVWYKAIQFADIDGDGNKDIVFATWGHGSYGIAWMPMVDPGSESIRYLTLPYTISDVMTIGDFDNDEDLDIVAYLDYTSQAGGNGVYWYENPDYRVGVDLVADVDQWGWVPLSWNRLGSSLFQVQRNGELITTTTDSTYVDHVDWPGVYEYTVISQPVSGPPKPSFPCTIHYVDQESVALIEDFDSGFPQSWTIEDYTATNLFATTWSVENSFCLPTGNLTIGHPYHCAISSLYAEFEGRAVTTSIPVIDNEHVELSFDYYFRKPIEQVWKLQLSVDGNPWTDLRVFDEGKREFIHIDLTDSVADADSFRVGFDGTGYWKIYECCIDNVIVTSRIPPVVLTFVPQLVNVPAEGGIVVYDGQLVSNIETDIGGMRYWIQVELPDGEIYDVPGRIVFDLPAHGQINAQDLTLTVPAAAPSGEYVFTGIVGYPGNLNLQESSSFTFEKEGTQRGTGFVFNPDEWQTTGSFAGDLDQPDASVPDVFALQAPYPNPFNEMTTLRIDLPVASELTVDVFNITGQRVTTLSRGQHTAGQHTLTLNGSDLASGLYFVQATVPGQMNEIRKLVLVK